jgi:hypothetical protein
MKHVAWLGAVVAVVFMAGPAAALTINDGAETPLYEIINDWFGVQVLGSSAEAASLVLPVPPNGVFSQPATPEVEAIFAGNEQTFGYYQPTGAVPGPGDRTDLFTVNTGDSASGFINPGGSPYGLYLESTGFRGTFDWFSENGLNADGMQHLLTFDLAQVAAFGNANYGAGLNPADYLNTWIWAWEDLPEFFEGKPASDMDYNDLVLVARIVPEPGSMLLMGAGVAALAVARRRFRKA